jgi:hypothetical protein
MKRFGQLYIEVIAAASTVVVPILLLLLHFMWVGQLCAAVVD